MEFIVVNKNKMKMLLKLVFCYILLASAQCYVLSVEKCRLEDSKCLVDRFQKYVPTFFDGITELGMEKIDSIDDIDFELSGLKFSLKNGLVKGLKNIIIDSVKWDVKKKTLEVAYHVDCSLRGQYTADGKILILPIKGGGDFKLKIKKMSVKIIIHYDIEKLSDGKDHVKPKKYSYDFDVKEGAHYHLTNLFNGDKQLGDNMLNYINSNWREISNEFGKPIMENLMGKIVKNVKQFLLKQATEDIAIL